MQDTILCQGIAGDSKPCIIAFKIFPKPTPCDRQMKYTKKFTCHKLGIDP